MPLAADQRYCLQCGERRAPMSSVLLGGPPPREQAPVSPPASPPNLPGGSSRDGAAQPRNATLTVIAGVGVLLLAMGVGVLIGRANAPKQASAPAQVITVAGPGGAGATTTPTEATFTDDWPSGTSGYSVQLQTLPQSGTTVSAVEAAKSAASAKGAKAVGALKSGDFSSLGAGNFVIYSGEFHKKAEAEKALAGLRKSFPAASVIHVSNGGSTGGGTGSSGGGSSSSGGGSSQSHPAPATVLKSLEHVKGKSYEERSRNLPNEVETG